MENPKKGHFNDHLRERTISLSINVYNLVQDKKLTLLVRPLVNQVIRSSSSVAANYRAATRARPIMNSTRKFALSSRNVTRRCFG